MISTKSLYHGTPSDIQAAAALLPDDCQTSLFIGHNPGWELAVHQLSNQNERMTTANAALFEIDAPDWQNLFQTSDRATLIDVLRPKQLDD